MEGIRTLDQEPDCIAIVPFCPDFVVIGTYSLIDTSAEDGTSNRRGSLQILPFMPRSPRSETVHRKDFPFGIYDLQFHPGRTDVLGVATSNGEMIIFEIDMHPEGDIGTPFKLVETGRVLVEQPHEDGGRRAIITQFQFLHPSDTGSQSPPMPSNDDDDVLILATTQFGNTKLLKVRLSPRTEKNEPSKTLQAQIINVHRQSLNLEAWTVLACPLLHQDQLLILSGGDDSQLVISSIKIPFSEPLANLDLDILLPTKLLTDKRTHGAGIVSICELDHFPTSTGRENMSSDGFCKLILTGSYDEVLRLFLLTPPSPLDPRCEFQLLSEYKMEGGVWRISVLDKYPGEQGSIDYILLVAGHTAGAFIVRLIASKSEIGGQAGSGWECTFLVEKSFTDHNSLVYAVVGKADAEQPGRWEILSTSFYDKRLCNWSLFDLKRKHIEKV